MTQPSSGATIRVTGIVQGVGFRPFIYNLAGRFNLSGRVKNTSSGVVIDAEGKPEDLQAFIRAVRDEAPPLALIADLEITSRPPNGFSDFQILPSQAISGEFQPVSPDVCLCPDCLREMLDPHDRRYRYPFINCTNCGPRFTIIRDIPYDRPRTTMADFPMCPDCTAEYEDPRDRRFHAQPVACPVCGPHIWLEDSVSPAGPPQGMDAETDALALQTARTWLAEGRILAVKGLGGFHLACDASNPAAVAELRRRKLRTGKPFALMLAGLEQVRRICELNSAEEAALLSIQRPIVILQRRSGSGAVADDVAPGQDTLGVMLPYTPLHVLLLEAAPGFPPALVMTSANISEEPIVSSNAEARQRLVGLADGFLMHNRDIHVRCDDSVVRVALGSAYPIRRARGYAPMPLFLPWEGPSVFAAGTELKNTFCMTRDRYAFLSHHIGDMQNYETLQSYSEGVRHYERLFRIAPQALACDLHPDYLATRYAEERAAQDGLPLLPVQHHHAHVAACMAENRVPEEETVIGVAFDGTGYGNDGAIWGGELLLASYTAFERRFHLRYSPLPGGDLAVLEPFRLALAWLDAAGVSWSEDHAPFRYLAAQPDAERKTAALRQQIRRGVNTAQTSSMGRLFDAAASLLGIRHAVSYEAQAAIELEAQAALAPAEQDFYEAGYQAGVIDPLPVILAMLTDLQAGAPIPVLAARFHNSVAQIVHHTCAAIQVETGISRAALSGGVWQNITLLQRSVSLLEKAGFEVLLHRNIPVNDGGVAFGQAAAAIQMIKRGTR